MAARRRNTSNEIGRPFNNLLRRLNASDFALIAPHLAHEEAKDIDLLYNTGDNVEIVHFPCGPGLVSYLVTNKDGRDFETILVGGEGAVGGIVSQGYLPAYTRIMVKFGGPFVRLHVGKLDAAKTKSATLRNVFARYADCMLAQIFQSTASRDPFVNNAPRNGSSRRWNAPRTKTPCRSRMSSLPPCWALTAAMPGA
jgi:hypothetical protein